MGQSRGENSTLCPVGQFSSKDKSVFLCLLVIHVTNDSAGQEGGRRELEVKRREGRSRGEERERVEFNE